MTGWPLYALDQYNYVFIHVPKTGGTSVRHALGMTLGANHLSASQLYDLYPHLCGRFSFAFVRNPWDRMVSYWSIGRPWRDRVLDWSLPPQVQYLDAPIDFVGRYESLASDFDVVCQSLGIRTPVLPHLLASERGHYREYYDDDLAAAVADRYAEDIARFGYTF